VADDGQAVALDFSFFLTVFQHRVECASRRDDRRKGLDPQAGIHLKFILAASQDKQEKTKK
jgi:hypothetical protein